MGMTFGIGEEITKEQWEKDHKHYRSRFERTFDKREYSRVKKRLDALFAKLSKSAFTGDEDTLFFDPRNIVKGVELDGRDRQFMSAMTSAGFRFSTGEDLYAQRIGYVMGVMLKDDGSEGNLVDFLSSRFDQRYIARCAVAMALGDGNWASAHFRRKYKDGLFVDVPTKWGAGKNVPADSPDVANDVKHIPEKHVRFVANLFEKNLVNDISMKVYFDNLAPFTLGRHVVCLSRDHRMIASMSTEQGWTSCMNLSTGCNAHYVGSSASAGAIVAYAVDREKIGKDDLRPSGRVLLKPYESRIGSGIVWRISKEYGSPPPWFVDSVYELLGTAFDEKDEPIGTYALKDGVYDDGDESLVTVASQRKLEYLGRRFKSSKSAVEKASPESVAVFVAKTWPSAMEIPAIGERFSRFDGKSKELFRALKFALDDVSKATREEIFSWLGGKWDKTQKMAFLRDADAGGYGDLEGVASFFSPEEAWNVLVEAFSSGEKIDEDMAFMLVKRAGDRDYTVDMDAFGTDDFMAFLKTVRHSANGKKLCKAGAGKILEYAKKMPKVVTVGRFEQNAIDDNFLACVLALDPDDMEKVAKAVFDSRSIDARESSGVEFAFAYLAAAAGIDADTFLEKVEIGYWFVGSVAHYFGKLHDEVDSPPFTTIRDKEDFVPSQKHVSALEKLTRDIAYAALDVASEDALGAFDRLKLTYEIGKMSGLKDTSWLPLFAAEFSGAEMTTLSGYNPLPLGGGAPDGFDFKDKRHVNAVVAMLMMGPFKSEFRRFVFACLRDEKFDEADAVIERIVEFGPDLWPMFVFQHGYEAAKFADALVKFHNVAPWTEMSRDTKNKMPPAAEKWAIRTGRISALAYCAYRVVSKRGDSLLLMNGKIDDIIEFVHSNAFGFSDALDKAKPEDIKANHAAEMEKFEERAAKALKECLQWSK